MFNVFFATFTVINKPPPLLKIQQPTTCYYATYRAEIASFYFHYDSAYCYYCYRAAEMHAAKTGARIKT